MLFFATCPKGLESLLAEELVSLGAYSTKETRAGVSFDMKLDEAYRVCLWSRLANHIYVPLKTAALNDVEDLYQLAYRFPWDNHMTVDNTFAINADLINAPINNNQYVIQRFKDGLVDYWRKKSGRRPDVQTEQPDFRFHILIKNNEFTLSLNMSGESLHKRKIRLEGGLAPLKENLAAALLIRAGWPDIAKAGGSLFDPLCGSGTFLIEGALIAADIAPGLLRDYFGFLQWREFKPAIWKALLDEANDRREAGLKQLSSITGQDTNANVVYLAKENVKRLGLSDYIIIEQCDLVDTQKLFVEPGLVITNPPYGVRLGEIEQLKETYQKLGALFKSHFYGWKCSVFTGNVDLAKALKLGPEKIYKFFNGAIACQLLNFLVRPPKD